MTATTDPLAQLHRAVTARQPGWADTLTVGSWWAGVGDTEGASVADWCEEER